MKHLLVIALLGALASEASAGRADISAYACTGLAGSTLDVENIDCAAGGVVPLLITFQPAERINDLVGAEVLIEMQVSQLVENGAEFWNFATVNAAALTSSPLRPTFGCVGFVDTFADSGSGSSYTAEVAGAYLVRIRAQAHRPTPRIVNAETKLFALRLIIDTGTSLESGSGTAAGCDYCSRLTLRQFAPVSASNAAVTVLNNSNASADHTVALNCRPGLPVQRRSWGSIKSLYR